ncbi:hypothetical protein [Roseicella aquatilis]|uniref:hypothetical protein n=1 Tax=Roseicella aquatilis TaxID=2527868 RepID=UPI001404F212|nr:hypothetical protein [Roseicella aquatilis]
MTVPGKAPAKAASASRGEGQFDLFTSLPGDLPTHDQMEMMEWPFFSLSRGKR